MTVSTLYNAEYDKDCKIKDQDKTAFDWCKEGNIKEMTRILEKSKAEANIKDDQVTYVSSIDFVFLEHASLH